MPIPPPGALLKEVDLNLVTAETRACRPRPGAGREAANGPSLNMNCSADVTLDQLGLDSLGRMEITLDVERQFGHSSDDVPENVCQLWGLAQGLTV